jgi:trehalose 6-phosphate synthase
VPIRYVNQGYDREDLAASTAHRESRSSRRSATDEPRRKEYVAAQDPEDPGVLILSRFAGAALQLKDALLVNPYSKEEISDAINRALQMPLEERIRRWKAMHECVSTEDVVWWRHHFVSALENTSRTAAAVEEKPRV